MENECLQQDNIDTERSQLTWDIFLNVLPLY